MEDSRQQDVSVFTVTIPMSSILAFRKAITAMKDIASFITLCTDAVNSLKISTIDHFCESAMYAHIPVSSHTQKAWVSIANWELNKVVTASRKSICAMTVLFHTKLNRAVFLNAKTKEPILVPANDSFYDTFVNIPSIVKRNYIFVPFISADFVKTLNNLAVCSAIINIKLFENGKLCLSCHFEYGDVLVEKELHQPCFAHASNLNERVICDLQCNVKFVKSIYNPLINCSKKSCLVGFPLKPGDPLVVQFLLTTSFRKGDTPHKKQEHAIYQQFVLYPHNAFNQHYWGPKSSQNSLQASFDNLSSTFTVC